MPPTKYVKTQFNGGEISPKAFGRSDLRKYPNGAEIIRNMVIQEQGGLARRSGTRYVSEVKDSADLTILYPFRVSSLASYIIEFGDKYCRFYADEGQVLNGGSPSEIATPWTSDQLRDLEFAQDKNELYVWHPDVQTRKISNTSPTTFRIRPFIAEGGPYLDRNRDITFFRLVPSSGTETITTATATDPVQITTMDVHTWVTGDAVYITGVSGMTEINDRGFNITVIDNKNFTLDNEDGTGYAPGTGGTAEGMTIIYSQDDNGDPGTPGVQGVNGDRGFLQTDLNRLLRWQDGADPQKYYHYKITLLAIEYDLLSTNTSTPIRTTMSGPTPYQNGWIVYLNESSNDELNDTAYIVSNVNGDGSRFDLLNLDGTDTDGTAIGASTGGVVHRSDLCRVEIQSGPDDPAVDPPADQRIRRSWSLGAWSDTTGWPKCGVFHQNRLFHASTDSEPSTLWGSESNVYDSYLSEPEGGTGPLDTSAITRTLNADKVVIIYHMLSHTRGLMLMTDEGEWLASTSVGTFDPLTPSNFGALEQTVHGSRPNVRPYRALNAVLFAQASGRKVRQTLFKFTDDQFVADNMTSLAEHITTGGLVDAAWKEEHDPIMWYVRSDGVLLGMTYDLNQEVFAWHRHVIGGTFQGGDAVVESVAVIRDDTNNLEDQLWMVVKRTIDGSDVRYVEFMGPTFESDSAPEEAFFVDSGLPGQVASYNEPELITDITKGNPTTVVATITGSSEIANGSTVHVDNIVGMTELNGNNYTLTNVSVIGDVHTFTLNVDSNNFADYDSGGTVRDTFTTVSGLDHLEGETVKVHGDGVQQADRTVSGGSITLETPASIAAVGLSAPFLFRDMPFVPGTAGYDPRMSDIQGIESFVMVLRSQNAEIGQVGERKYPLEYDDESALFTGIIPVGVGQYNALRYQLEISGDSTYPFNLLQIGTELSLAP